MRVPVFYLFALLAFCTSCADRLPTVTAQNTGFPSETPSPPHALFNGELQNSSVLNQRILGIDFYNLSYEWCTSFHNPRGRIKLTNGEKTVRADWLKGPNKEIRFNLVNVFYYDFTNDGEDEALVTLVADVYRDSAACSYLFTLYDGKPTAIWSHFDGGGGFRTLRRLSTNYGSLIVEEYDYSATNKDEKRVNKSKDFTRETYRWIDGSFRMVNTQRVPNPDDSNLSYPLPKNPELTER